MKSLDFFRITGRQELFMEYMKTRKLDSFIVVEQA